MESKFSKLQVDVPKAALQGDGKGAKSPVSAEFKAALSAELESIARAQNPGKDTAESAALQRLSNGKNMPLIASGLISPKSSYSLETVLPDISTKDFDVYVLGPQVPESRFVLRSKELAESSLYRSQVVANPMVKGAVLPDANKRTPSPDAKDVSLISRVGVLPGQRQLDSVRGEAVAVRSKITELFTPVGTDPKSIREQSPIQGFDDAIRGSGPTANRVAPDAQMTPPIAQQALASTDDAVRGSGPAANRVTPEAQMTPAVAQRALASTDDAVRGSGPTANRVTPEAQMTPTVAQRALASTDDAVRGSGPTANRVTPEAQMTPAVAQQAPSPMSEAVLSRNAAPPAAAEIVLSNSPARGTEAKNKTAGKAVNEAVDVKLAKLEAELSGREAHKPRSGELVNKGEKLETKLIRGLELKDAHVPQRSAETLTAYLPIADDITASKPTDGKAISGEFTYHSEARVSSGVSADRSSFDSKVMANNSTDRASLSAGGAGSAFTAAIGKQLIDKISAGTERVRLVLHPKELGVVDVTMDVKNGKVDAILASANPVTREMLGDNLGRLRESLMQAGFDSGDVEVSDRPASDGSSDQKGAAPTAMQFVDTDGAVKSKDEITEIDLFLDSDEIDFWV
jgi:flagellar hook-length control protein FliK